MCTPSSPSTYSAITGRRAGRSHGVTWKLPCPSVHSEKNVAASSISLTILSLLSCGSHSIAVSNAASESVIAPAGSPVESIMSRTASVTTVPAGAPNVSPNESPSRIESLSNKLTCAVSPRLLNARSGTSGINTPSGHSSPSTETHGWMRTSSHDVIWPVFSRTIDADDLIDDAAENVVWPLPRLTPASGPRSCPVRDNSWYLYSISISPRPPEPAARCAHLQRGGPQKQTN